MTTPKVNTIRRGDSRFYVAPDTDAKVPGVTSILGMLPKGFLKFWAAKMVAEEAVNDLGALVSLALRENGAEAAIDYLKRAPDRNTRKAADTGTAAHDLFERMAKGETLGRVHRDLEPFVRHFDEFQKTVKPEFVFLEETVWSDTVGYAGSFDWYAIIDGQKVWGDNKTTRSGIHAEVGLQLAAYRHADNIIRPDGSRIRMPKADGGAVFHVRPEGWSLVPVKCGDEEFEVFKHLREIFRWEKELKGSMIGQPAYSGPGAASTSGPQRRVPRVRREVAK